MKNGRNRTVKQFLILMLPLGIVTLSVAVGSIGRVSDFITGQRIRDYGRRISWLATSVTRVECMVLATSPVYGGLGTQRLLYQTVGYVQAGVDISQIVYDSDIITGRITLSVPEPECINAWIDAGQCSAFEWDLAGAAMNGQLVSLARQCAQDQLLPAAESVDFLQRTKFNAELALKRIAALYGYEPTNVEIHWIPSSRRDEVQ